MLSTMTINCMMMCIVFEGVWFDVAGYLCTCVIGVGSTCTLCYNGCQNASSPDSINNCVCQAVLCK